MKSNKISPDVPVVLVGINSEVERTSAKEKQQLAWDLGLDYFETHLKRTKQVDRIVKSLIRQVIT